MHGERVAAISLRCRRCDAQLVLLERRMFDEGDLVYARDTINGAMWGAGPDGDPWSRWAFDCGRCGALDQLVTSKRLERVSAELLARCKADDTPRTERLRI